MLQYQQTTAAQKCYFDPCKPFERRLFNESWQKDNIEKKENYNKNKDYGKNKDNQNQAQNEQRNEVVEYSLKRVMKTLNNYILNEY